MNAVCWRISIHPVEPSGSSSIFLPCFFCSLFPDQCHRGLEARREQLVCLPALLATANLMARCWLSPHYTSHIQSLHFSAALMMLHSNILTYCNTLSILLWRRVWFNKEKESVSRSPKLGYCFSPPSLSQTWRLTSFFCQLSPTHIRALFISPSYRDPFRLPERKSTRQRQRWRGREEHVEHIGGNTENRQNERFRLLHTEDVWGGLVWNKKIVPRFQQSLDIMQSINHNRRPCIFKVQPHELHFVYLKIKKLILNLTTFCNTNT